MGWTDRGYEPLDVMKPETFKRVQAPPEEMDDPNAEPDPEEERNGWFDFDIDTLEGARNAVRPAALLLGAGGTLRLIAGAGTFAIGQTGNAAFGGGSPEFWALAIGGLISLVIGVIFVTIAIWLVADKSRIAGFGAVGAFVLLAAEKLAILTGLLAGGFGILSIVYVGLVGMTAFLAVQATWNFHKMKKLGVESLKPDETGDPGTSAPPAEPV